MKKILITGGNGYIGNNLTKFLYMHGGDIQIDISDYNASKPLAQHLKLKHIEKYDGIVHLAALSGIFACEENYIEAIEKNLLTANNVFCKASTRGIPVVFTSSQAAKEPFSSKYANLKNQCEMLAELYNNTSGKNYVIRLANVYGGDQYLIKKQTCVKQFITKYREGNPLEIHGKGKQKRDFVHVLDVCNAIMLLLKYKPLDKTPMDIGTGIGTSILDLAKMFPRRKNYHYKFIEGRNTGTDSSIADTSVAEKRIGFKAERKLEDYIKSCI